MSPCAAMKEVAGTCAYFKCLADNDHIYKAYGMMIKGETLSCESREFIWAKVRVLAANRQYEEALGFLTDLREDFPGYDAYLNEELRLTEISKENASSMFVSMRPLTQLNSPADDMIAWLHRDMPLVINEQSVYQMYFPQKTRSPEGYDFQPDQRTINDSNVKEIIRRIQKQDYYTVGPGCALGDSMLLFTAVKKRPYVAASKAGQLSIFSLDLRSGKAKPRMLAIAKRGFNDGFPVYNERNKSLIFSSDRPGGQGGMDLWTSAWRDGKWSEPLPLPGKVNTPDHELYPDLWGDTLYFSSDRSSTGYGGSDIYLYAMSIDSVWNPGEPINSLYDDFQFCLVDNTKAFLVSNRPGGRGGDDIYEVNWKSDSLFFDEIAGDARWSAEAIGSIVTLVDDEKRTLQTSVINAQGQFRFYNVEGTSKYEIVVPDVAYEEGFKIHLYDGSGKMIKELVSDGSNVFKFELLMPNDYRLEPLPFEDTSILVVDIFGKVKNVKESKVGGLQIILLDSIGDVIGNTYTSLQGDFYFQSVHPNDTYIIKSEVEDAFSTIHIIDERGNIINSIVPNESDEFVYVRLGPNDKVVTITNELSQQVRVSDKEQFEMGHVYFDLNAFEINEDGRAALLNLITILKQNPHVDVELSGHTDSRGSDIYNLRLSEWRIDVVMRFLASGGVERSRLQGTGYGERKLRNHCSDGIHCSERDHAKNRRTEFRIFEPEKDQ